MKKRIQKRLNLHSFIRERFQLILLSLLFLLFLVLRFYEIETYNPFGWDQVDNAWAAKKILVDNEVLLSGMVAKGNSGFHIGPLYYYMIAIVYWFTRLDPIASGIFAGITACITFWGLFLISKKLFSFPVAFIAVFINVVSFAGIMFDRVQWPVNFIPIIGFGVFFALYNVLIGKEKYILLLALILGFSFHIHFTAIFIPIIILLALPFVPKTKKTLFYSLWGIGIVLVFLIPSIINELVSKSSDALHMTSYLSTYYHGFHLKRVMQLIADGFIQFRPYLHFKQLDFMEFVLFPLFIFLYCYKKMSRENILFCYLMSLFFIVPWFVFATYKGEISDYYFSINRFIALIIISYILYRFFLIKTIFPKILLIILLGFYTNICIREYFSSSNNNLKQHRENVEKIGVIQYQDGVPESYIYDLKVGKIKLQ